MTQDSSHFSVHYFKAKIWHTWTKVGKVNMDMTNFFSRNTEGFSLLVSLGNPSALCIEQCRESLIKAKALRAPRLGDLIIK